MQQKEKTILLIYRWLMIALGIFHIATAVVNFSQKTYFYAVMALGGLLLGPVLILFWRILRLEPSYTLNLMIAVFFILLYTIGVALQGYNIPYYDKFCHTLSGTVTAFGGLLLFLLIKPEKTFTHRELPLGTVFSFLTAAAIAGIWEICEYVISLIFHNDPQRVVLSGVEDTMIDMVVCIVGALLYCAYICLAFRKNADPFRGILNRITKKPENEVPDAE